MTPSEAPKALQASECSELLDPTRANCWISAQHQPGKFARILGSSEPQQFYKCNNGNSFRQPGGSRWIPWPTMSRNSSWERLERAANLGSRSAESQSWAWHQDPQFKLLVPGTPRAPESTPKRPIGDDMRAGARVSLLFRRLLLCGCGVQSTRREPV